MAKIMLCRNCGTQDRPKLKTRGSLLIELVLWIFFIIPGLIYSIWRHTSRYKGCPNCESQNIIPLKSPMAQQILMAQRQAITRQHQAQPQSPPPIPDKPKEPEEPDDPAPKTENGRYIIPDI